ncbi:hypothetical protein OROGR_025139 [Orobanche gracilis]
MATASSNVSTGALPMSGKVWEMIQSMKEIVGNDFSDHEIYLALKDNMDPNASTIKLLHQVPHSLGYRRNSEDSGNPSDRSNAWHGGGYLRTGNAGKNRESEVRDVEDRVFVSSRHGGTIGGNEKGAVGGSIVTSDISKLPDANGYTQNSGVPNDCQPGLTKDTYFSVATVKMKVDERRNAIPRAGTKEREQNSRNKSKVTIFEVIGTSRKSAFAPSELAPNDACDDIEAQASTSASPPALISFGPRVIRPPSPISLGEVSSDPSASTLTLSDPSSPEPAWTSTCFSISHLNCHLCGW